MALLPHSARERIEHRDQSNVIRTARPPALHQGSTSGPSVGAFGVAKNLLSLAAFGGALYSLDQTSVVKCVFKARCVVGTRIYIVGKMSIGLSHIDRRAHESTRDRGLVGYQEWDVRR